MTPNNELNSKKTPIFWMMIAILVPLTAIALYNQFVKGETQFIQFSMVFSLLTLIFALAKSVYPAILCATIALGFLAAEVYLALAG